jgi:Zn-dependent peptidase ImmA (M78 family)
MNKKLVDIPTKKKVANLTIKWCRDFFGVNERKRTKLKISFSNKNRKLKNAIIFGNYCFWRNTITIYLNHCITIEDIISTVIHEYTHYLQSRTIYMDYQEKYYYSTNPYEREAKRNEEKHTKTCLKDISCLITK